MVKLVTVTPEFVTVPPPAKFVVAVVVLLLLKASTLTALLLRSKVEFGATVKALL